MSRRGRVVITNAYIIPMEVTISEIWEEHLKTVDMTIVMCGLDSA